MSLVSQDRRMESVWPTWNCAQPCEPCIQSLPVKPHNLAKASMGVLFLGLYLAS